jgi:hypothetical protein
LKQAASNRIANHQHHDRVAIKQMAGINTMPQAMGERLPGRIGRFCC